MLHAATRNIRIDPEVATALEAAAVNGEGRNATLRRLLDLPALPTDGHGRRARPFAPTLGVRATSQLALDTAPVVDLPRLEARARAAGALLTQLVPLLASFRRCEGATTPAYEAVLRDAKGKVVWECPHVHRRPRTTKLGDNVRLEVSALECAERELLNRRLVAANTGPGGGR